MKTLLLTLILLVFAMPVYAQCLACDHWGGVASSKIEITFQGTTQVVNGIVQTATRDLGDGKPIELADLKPYWEMLKKEADELD